MPSGGGGWDGAMRWRLGGRGVRAARESGRRGAVEELSQHHQWRRFAGDQLIRTMAVIRGEFMGETERTGSGATPPPPINSAKWPAAGVN